jgi:predicted nucleic-acid-binding Zn-ribbon protein
MIVNGYPLRCPHCGGESFKRSRLPMGGPGLSLLGFDLDGEDAVVFTCRTCGRIELFGSARTTEVDLRGEFSDCNRCGTRIPAAITRCPNCSEPK